MQVSDVSMFNATIKVVAGRGGSRLQPQHFGRPRQADHEVKRLRLSCPTWSSLTQFDIVSDPTGDSSRHQQPTCLERNPSYASKRSSSCTCRPTAMGESKSYQLHSRRSHCIDTGTILCSGIMRLRTCRGSKSTSVGAEIAVKFCPRGPEIDRVQSPNQNLICCHSPVIKWSFCLTRRRLSNAHTCKASKTGPAGRTRDDRMETTSGPWTFLGFVSPRGLLPTEDKHGPGQKQNQTHARGSQRRIHLEEREYAHWLQALPTGGGEQLGRAVALNCSMLTSCPGIT
ncbi:hypothetical protein AAY473_004174 [Plecturocebus cupreus]